MLHGQRSSTSIKKARPVYFLGGVCWPPSERTALRWPCPTMPDHVTWLIPRRPSPPQIIRAISLTRLQLMISDLASDLRGRLLESHLTAWQTKGVLQNNDAGICLRVSWPDDV